MGFPETIRNSSVDSFSYGVGSRPTRIHPERASVVFAGPGRSPRGRGNCEPTDYPLSDPRSVAESLFRPSLRKLRVMAMYHTHSTTPENAETARPTLGR